MSETKTRIGARWGRLRSTHYLDRRGAAEGAREQQQAARLAAQWEATQTRQWAQEQGHGSTSAA